MDITHYVTLNPYPALPARTTTLISVYVCVSVYIPQSPHESVASVCVCVLQRSLKWVSNSCVWHQFQSKRLGQVKEALVRTCMTLCMCLTLQILTEPSVPDTVPWQPATEREGNLPSVFLPAFPQRSPCVTLRVPLWFAQLVLIKSNELMQLKSCADRACHPHGSGLARV